nr:ulp1 protease family, C-terminal catalytic domain-containing protein [Tanacetum cinerariifolium]
TRTRRLIYILKKNWKDVTKEEKNFLWSDIKAHFRLENDDVKKQTLLSCGPKGYRGFEKQWEEVRNDPDKATELHLIPDLHCSNYCLARAPRDKVGIKPLPAELIDVSKKLVQVASELSQSSNEPKSGVDPLIMVLKLEHGGRTRGVGYDIGYKKGVEGYVRKKRTSEQRKDNEEIRNEVRQQMKEELKSSDFWLEMRAELKMELRNEILAEHNLSPREDDVPSLVELKRLNLSTTKSIVREEQQGEQNESSSTKPVDVSTSVFKIQCIKKLRKGHMKVAVLKVMEKHRNMELLVPDDDVPYLESAVNGFIQWPIFAIGRYKKGKVNDTPKEPNKKDEASEDTTNKQKSIQRVKNEKAANRKRLQDLENDILTKPQSVIDGYNKWMSRADIAEPYSIYVNKKVFGQTNEFYFALNATDIIELLTYTKLELGILTLFEMSLYQLKDHSSPNKVGFLNPMMITADLCFHEKFATMDYLAQSLTCYEFYLAPFLQGRHYVLLIICPKDGRGFILNLQKDSQIMRTVTDSLDLWTRKVVGSLKWDFPLVNRQLKDWECGYYVMKWMHDFVLKYQNDNFPNTVPWNNERPLDTKELNTIIGAWFTLRKEMPLPEVCTAIEEKKKKLPVKDRWQLH